MSHYRLPLRDEPWGAGVPYQDCPVCGEHWRPWCGSHLPCHAKCLLTDEAAEIVRDPARRREVFLRPETRWYREQGETVDDLVAGAPLIELTFVDSAAWLND